MKVIDKLYYRILTILLTVNQPINSNILAN